MSDRWSFTIPGHPNYGFWDMYMDASLGVGIVVFTIALIWTAFGLLAWMLRVLSDWFVERKRVARVLTGDEEIPDCVWCSCVKDADQNVVLESPKCAIHRSPAPKESA